MSARLESARVRTIRGRFRAFATVFERELVTVARTPGYALLGAGLLAVLGGFLLAGGGAATGFVPAVVDLLLPTELLVPLVAVALGYRALLVDVRSGEIDVIRTYPVGTVAYVLGVLFARLAALVAILLVPYLAVGAYVLLAASPDTGIYATHAGVDSGWLFVRFLALVVPLGSAYLVAAAAVSTLAASRRSALALAGVALLLGVLGGDLAVLRTLGDGGAIGGTLALTPNGAFRGLVLEHVVAVAFDAGDGFVTPGRAVASLVGWTLLGTLLAVATTAYGRRVATELERIRG